MRDWIAKYLPSKEWIHAQSSLGPVRHLILEPELWRLHRRSVGGAFFIGLFCAFLPIPVGQTLIAVLLAVFARCNLPIAVALVWITNPLTIGPIFFFAYKLGAWLLGTEATNTGWELSWQWLREKFAEVWRPLILGSLVCGWVSGLTGAVLSRLLWRLHIMRRWQQRRARRAARRKRNSATGADGAARPSAAPGPDSGRSP